MESCAMGFKAFTGVHFGGLSNTPPSHLAANGIYLNVRLQVRRLQ